MFVHPAEASHGDLGMITGQDVVLAISNSGESEELTVILPVLSRQGVPMIAMTGGPNPRWRATPRHARQQRCAGGLPAQPGPHRQHHRPAGHGRRAGRGAARRARLQGRGLRPLAPGRRAGPQAAHACQRRDAQGDDVPQVRPDASFQRADARDEHQGLRRLRRGRPTAVLGIFTDGDLRRLVEAGATCAAAPPPT
jgi:arabinose-5-phosphate isomerase